MNPDNTILMLPYSTMEERTMLISLLNGKTEEEKSKFMTQYILQRKDPQQILIFTLIGLFGIAGIQRFVLDEILIGLLYFFTAGFCFIGTIVDIVRYKDLAFEYNRKMAHMIHNGNLV